MVENMGKSIRDKYPKELGLKVEHQCDHATFLNSNITIKERNPINKLIDKRHSLPFSIVRMPHIERNIPQKNFYSQPKVSFKELLVQIYASWT